MKIAADPSSEKTHARTDAEDDLLRRSNNKIRAEESDKEHPTSEMEMGTD